MMRPNRTTLALALVPLALAGSAEAAELRGSRASMVRQNEVARAERLPFLRTSAEVDRLVVRGALEPVWGGRDYALANVSHPYARPEVRLFVERLAAQYRRATGETLVVTSLTRPEARQPGNAHALSVHPAGMAVDLRVPARAEDRKWLEETLLELEAEGLVDVTRERRPPHYHVAVFPDAYRRYADRLEAAEALTRVTRAARSDALPTRFASAVTPEAGGEAAPVAAGQAGSGTAAALLTLLFGALAAGALGGRRLVRTRVAERPRILL